MGRQQYEQFCLRFSPDLIDIQLSGCSEQALRQAQEELNTVYDQFTKKYGYITAKGNARAFRDDGDYPLLCSLEMVDEDGVVSKADMFTRQTIKAIIIMKPLTMSGFGSMMAVIWNFQG